MDMSWLKIRVAWFFKIGIPHFFERIKSAVWNRRTKLYWDRLWIRKSESHPSLGTDPIAVCYMTREQKRVYFHDLAKRIWIAHERDMARDLAAAESGSVRP